MRSQRNRDTEARLAQHLPQVGFFEPPKSLTAGPGFDFRQLSRTQPELGLLRQQPVWGKAAQHMSLPVSDCYAINVNLKLVSHLISGTTHKKVLLTQFVWVETHTGY